MSLPPHLPKTAGSDKEYVHIRCLIANIHRPKNVSRPPTETAAKGPLDIVEESPVSSDNERNGSGSDRSSISGTDEVIPPQRAKSNSIAGSLLAPPVQHNKKRRPSFLHLHIGGSTEHAGPFTAGPHFNVPRFTVTAPPGEPRRFSHGFAAFHGFALRRHSNTV